MLSLISKARKAAAADGHRALVLLPCLPDGALRSFAADCEIPFIDARNSADRADRITHVLGSEFDVLIHETDDVIDAGLLAALAGTVKAGGVLILGLRFYPGANAMPSSLDPSSVRFSRLLNDIRSEFPDKVLFVPPYATSPDLPQTATPQTVFEQLTEARLTQDGLSATRVTHVAHPARHQLAARHEQDLLLQRACDYLQQHKQGCITITGRRGRGKSALLGRIASWLTQQKITFAVTSARQSALTSMHRHSFEPGSFVAAEAAHLSTCSVLLVDEAGSLPLSVLERFLTTHTHVVYCTTVEGYENAGRAFAIRFHCVASLYQAHALSLEPRIPWRWNAGDPVEGLMDGLLMGSGDTENVVASLPAASLDSRKKTGETGVLPAAGSIRLLDRKALAFDEALLREVFGLLRDTHYQTSAADLSHLLDAPDLQLWVLEENQHIKAALLLVMEGEIDTDLHEAIVSKQRRLPHQLLPQLLAQSADQSQPLEALYARVIRIAVAGRERRRGLGTQLLKAVECAMTNAPCPVDGLGASFASDAASIAFWRKNGYLHFHTGFKPNPRTGKPAIAVIKSLSPQLDPAVEQAVYIHTDNQLWQNNSPDKPETSPCDTALLRRFARGQRSMHDSHAALCRLALHHPIPLQKPCDASRRQHEAALREAVAAVLE